MKLILSQIAIFALIAFTGCSTLSGGAILTGKAVELDKSHLSCKANPEVIDGDMRTSSALDTLNIEIGAEYRGVASSSSGMIIELDKPTYITNVEIYPEIKEPKVYVTAMSPESEKIVVFDRILDPIDKSAQGKSPTVLKINKEILYIIITAKREVDTKKAIELDPRTGEKTVQTKGATVNEVKFYTRAPME
jgi:hypothetical protein